MMAEDDFDLRGQFKGKRSRLFIEKINAALTTTGEAEATAKALSLCSGHYLAKLDPKQDGKVKTLVFLSPLEYETFAQLLHSLKDVDKQKLVEAGSLVDTAKLADEDDGEEDAEEETTAKQDKGEKKLSPKQFTKFVEGFSRSRSRKPSKTRACQKMPPILLFSAAWSPTTIP